MKVTLYANKTKRQIEITNVSPDDEKFFADNNVSISMEDLNGNMIVYGDYGGKEEAKAISFNGSKSCEDTMSELRGDIERKLATLKPA